jgi:hypothetical protein
MQYTYSRTNIYSVPMIMYRDSSIYIQVYKIVSASYFCLLTSVLPYYFILYNLWDNMHVHHEFHADGFTAFILADSAILSTHAAAKAPG